jgi:hypothetical protein
MIAQRKTERHMKFFPQVQWLWHNGLEIFPECLIQMPELRNPIKKKKKKMQRNQASVV